MNEIVIPLLSLALGLALGWILARRHARANEESLRANLEASNREKAEAEARLKAQEEMQAESEKAFGAVATEALKASTDQFMKLAKTQFESEQKTGSAELDKRKKAIEELLKPLEEKLKDLDKHTRALEGTRQKAYGELTKQIEALSMSTEKLNTSSTALTTALRGSSQARGRWGETALRNIAELAGMTKHCDFKEQVTDQGGNRPDMVIHLPGEERIPIDSKVPLKDYMEGCEATDPSERQRAFAAHARALRGFVRQLSSKDYAANLEGQVDYTVMFLPAEPILAAAFEHDPALQDYAMGKRILIATPVTLMALLRTVNIYWNHEKVQKNTEAVWECARELYERVTIYQEHIESLGKNLQKTLESYNKAMGAFERRVLPTGRKMDELGAVRSNVKALDDPTEIVGEVRAITSGD
jgi:DNA recombination protein RmuC